MRAKKTFAKAACAILATAAIAVPAALRAEDAYIESDGTSGIDIGYKLKDNSRIEVDFKIAAENGGNYWLFGADDGDSTKRKSMKIPACVYTGTDKFYFRCSDGATDKNYNVARDDDRHVAVFDIKEKQALYITGADTTSMSLASLNFSGECTQTTALFCRHKYDGSYSNYIKARIYGVKVYEDDTLVHDYVPCVDGDKPGFLDGETFYANSANASHFSAGGDCTYVNSSRPYVGTGANPAGRQFIDTLYYATTNTRCEIDYVLRKAPTASAWLFSGSGSDAYYGVYIKADGTGFGEHNGTGWTTKAYAGAGATNILRTAIVDYPNNKLYVCTYGETNLSVMANAAAGKFYDVETIKIGGKYNAGEEFANIDIYGFRIYENGVLVRDFRPFWRNGFPGLMCIKTCVFVSCYPTTAAVGPTQTLRFANISELQLPNPDDSALVTVEVPYAEPYVELDKSEGQFIVFRYIPKKKTRVELDYALASSWDSGTWNLFRGVSAAAADATKHYYGAYLNASGFGFINTVSTWKSGLAAGGVTNAVGVKRTAILDNVANVGALVTEGFTNGWAACENDFDAGTTGGRYIHLGTNQNNDREFASIRIYACRIYEDGEMKRNFTPTTSADHLCACLYDYYSGQYAYVSNATGRVESPLYGGTFPAVIAEGKTVKVAYRRPSTLTAVAPGATSFLWKKNNEEIEGETGSTLAVDWRDGDDTDTYSVTPFYAYDGGITIKGGESSTEVKYLKRGLMAIFK